MYTEFNSMDNARYVFDQILDKTIFVWNAIIRGFALAGNGEEALSLYYRMNQIGIPSDRFTYTFALKALVVSSPSVSLIRKGKEIHGHILRHGFESYVHIVTTLIDMYARFGCVSYAGYVFVKMPERNVVSWSAIIACYAKNERPFEALQLFWEMMSETFDVIPNSVTMVSVLQACAALSALGQGKLLHCYVLRKGFDSTLSVMNSLVNMYLKCGSLENGRQIFDQMVKKDIVSWNSIIAGHAINGYGKEAVVLFRDMIRSGISPNIITFVSVLGACSHAGLVDEGKQIFDSMALLHKVVPSVEHYACMVDLLGRAGRLEEAAKVVEGMRIEPGPTVWGSLLGACRIHCNVELAERASIRLFQLEPVNAGNFVLLADIYAAAKMWEEVSKVKKLLEARNLQKVPGCSWIEVKRKIYSFVSIDELNPQMEQLHALLVHLSSEMKEKGYVPDTRVVLYELDQVEKERILLGHSEKLALAFGLINSGKGETIRITKNLRLCEDCHSVTKFISKFTNREILVRDVNRIHCFREGFCSCGDYW
ncbi:Pentatricopeptide repeat-containing protein [Thalictrum thalictroides]|uniref:Pentatricopeptide repeat-containing protein n=1 Tax=Thalictrum thalictroides TaxID=46969 RepID=A0A7J6VV83_THATH|nr:Pentatricopeptide repeat-containing protein [Thalictrum thalictroides]